MEAGHILLVGSADVLAACFPGDAMPEAAPFLRETSRKPGKLEAWASRVEATGAELVVLIDPTREERESLDAQGVRAVTWGAGWLPVADALYRDRATIAPGDRVFFFGATDARRDRFLQPVKHRFDVLHLVGGADQRELGALMDRCDVAIDLLPDEGLPHLDRIGPAMAQGMLVLAEAPVGREGVSRGIEMFTFSSPEELELLVSDSREQADELVEVRMAAREAAEVWRASTALRELVAAQPGG